MAQCTKCGGEIGRAWVDGIAACTACGARFRVGHQEANPVPTALPLVMTATPAEARSDVPLAVARTCPACEQPRVSSRVRCPSCGVLYRDAREARAAMRDKGDAFALERAAFNKGLVGGLAMIVIAVVWFTLGWAAGYIFFYPPVLAVIGLVAVVNGLTGGTRSAPAPRRRRRRR